MDSFHAIIRLHTRSIARIAHSMAQAVPIVPKPTQILYNEVMTSLLTIVRLRLQPASLTSAFGTLKGAFAPLAADGTITGASSWRSLSAHNERLFLLEIPNEEAASRVSQASAAEEILSAASSAILGVPDVRVMQIHRSMGLQPHELPEGAIISSSIRVADPGSQHVLFDDYQMVFEELSPIPGFRGWAYGSPVNVPEEVIGLGFWDDLDSLHSSIPATAAYRIDSFLKIGNLL